jgi:hypothetical protein
MTQKEILIHLLKIVGDDSLAVTYQTMAGYRLMLINELGKLTLKVTESDNNKNPESCKNSQ